MALQSGVITKDTRQLQDDSRKMPIHKKADIHHSLKAEAVSALELSNQLHSTLDIGKIFEIYEEQTLKHVPFDSIKYSHPEDSFCYSNGKTKRHSCQYRLLMGGNNLGEIEFTRSRKFTEPETIKLEYMLSSLLNPLHNSLMYRQAVTNALVDPLTSVCNRSAFDASVSREISLAKRHKNPLAMIILDIDLFKNVNDTFGHLFGDCVLRDVAKRISEEIRDSDIVYRYGGEEFVILLRNTTKKGAHQLAERIRESVSRLNCNYGGNSTNVTVSQGVALLKATDTENDFFERADKAMYEAKHNGRNRTVVSK